MTRAARVVALREAGRYLEANGVQVLWDPGWASRGRDTPHRPAGHVLHTTEDARPVRWEALLPILRNGHGRISGNAICNTAIRQPDGLVAVIAAGLAWHAGSGSHPGMRGNPDWGCEYQRGQTQQLTPAMLRAGRLLDIGLQRSCGYPTGRIVDHFEWTARKSDRKVRDGVRVDSAAWRRSLTAPTPPPQPDAPTIEEDDMYTLIRRRGQAAVWAVSAAHAFHVRSAQALTDLRNSGLLRDPAVHDVAESLFDDLTGGR